MYILFIKIFWLMYARGSLFLCVCFFVLYYYEILLCLSYFPDNILYFHYISSRQENNYSRSPEN